MAIRITTIRCPHCRYVLHYGVNDSGKQFGCMLQVCPSCKETYFASNFIEIALKGKEYYYKHEPKKWVVHLCYFIMAIPICIIAFLVYSSNNFLVDQGIYYALFGMSFAAMITYSIYSTWSSGFYIDDLAKFEEEASLSYHRLSNPEYALLLQNKGYQVPSEFLPN